MCFYLAELQRAFDVNVKVDVHGMTELLVRELLARWSQVWVQLAGFFKFYRCLGDVPFSS